MASYINHDNIKIITKDGEIKIHLSIDLNVNMNGEFNSSGYLKKTNEETILKTEEEKTIWQVPDFSAIKNKDKVKFGKQE